MEKTEAKEREREREREKTKGGAPTANNEG